MTDNVNNSEKVSDAHNKQDQHEFINAPRAGLFRRLAVMVYDFLVVVAITMVAVIVAFIISQIVISLGFVHLDDGQEHYELLEDSILYQAYLLSCIITFYLWFWTHGGQTVGMKTWRMRIQNTDGSHINMKQAGIRLVASLFGLGNLWLIFDRKNKLALQDKLAKCEVVVLSKEANQHKNWQKLY